MEKAGLNAENHLDFGCRDTEPITTVRFIGFSLVTIDVVAKTDQRVLIP
jgi:hypothetical protein